MHRKWLLLLSLPFCIQCSSLFNQSSDQVEKDTVIDYFPPYTILEGKVHPLLTWLDPAQGVRPMFPYQEMLWLNSNTISKSTYEYDESGNVIKSVTYTKGKNHLITEYRYSENLLTDIAFGILNEDGTENVLSPTTYFKYQETEEDEPIQRLEEVEVRPLKHDYIKKEYKLIYNSENKLVKYDLLYDDQIFQKFKIVYEKDSDIVSKIIGTRNVMEYKYYKNKHLQNILIDKETWKNFSYHKNRLLKGEITNPIKQNKSNPPLAEFYDYDKEGQLTKSELLLLPYGDVINKFSYRY